MKKFIALGLLMGSLSVSAQSYLVLNNGVMLTTDKAGFVYDFGHFVVPYEVKVNGGNFLVEKKVLITVDQNGYKYDKDQKIEKIKGRGLNYVLTDSNELVTVDTMGFFYKFDKDDVLKRVVSFGGNFFTAKDSKKKSTLLYTVNDKGNYFNMTLPGLDPADIVTVGGTFFTTKNGTAYTVSKDGFVYPKTERVGQIRKMGGNFFVDSSNKLFTVSETGILSNPVIPMNLNVTAIAKTGANYMIDAEGRLFAVDNNGNVFERTMRNHDLRNTKVTSH